MEQRLARVEAQARAAAESLGDLLAEVDTIRRQTRAQGGEQAPAPPQKHGGAGGAAGGSEAPSLLLTALFIHEVWLFMQHANVLLNPYLQRLDRQYGVALLRRRMCAPPPPPPPPPPPSRPPFSEVRQY